MRNFPLSLRRWLALVVFTLATACAQRPSVGEVRGDRPTVEAHPASEDRAETRAQVAAVGEAEVLVGNAASVRGEWNVRVEGLPFDPIPRDGKHNVRCPVVVYEAIGSDGKSVRDLGFVEEGTLEVPVRSWISRHVGDVAEVRALGASANGLRWRPIEGFESVRRQTEGERVLRFELAPKTHLIVKDAETGEPLERVELRFLHSDEPPPRYQGTLTGVGDEALGTWRSCDGQSIELESLVPSTLGLGGRVELRLRAEGRAERQFAVMLGTGGAHEVLLERAGSARFTWLVPADLEDLGYHAQLPLALRLEPESPGAANAASAPDFELLPFQSFEPMSPEFGKDERGLVRRIELNGLAPGAYVAQFELEPQGLMRSTTLARATFTVGVEARAEVELETALDPDARPSRLAFELDIPAELGATPKCRLVVQPFHARAAPSGHFALDDSPSDPWGETGEIRLDYDPSSRRSSSFLISKGECELLITGELEYRVRVDVGAGTEERRRISIPAPVGIRVCLVSDDLRAEDLPPVLGWSTRFESGSSRGFLTFAAAGRPGVFELSSLSDRIELRCPPRVTFEGTAASALQLEGAREHTVRIVPLPLLRIRLSHAGRPHSVPPEFVAEIVDADTDPESFPSGLAPNVTSRLRARHDGGEYEQRVWLPKPGEYKLFVRKLDGFRPFPPQTVTLAARGDSVIELQLIPER